MLAAGALVPGVHDVTSYPRPVNVPGGNCRLRLDSPCIDAGMDAGVAIDINGDPRPMVLGYDIGADEFRIREVVLPLIIKRDRSSHLMG